ncbi:3155_t:CDS:2, partial [Acaulospora morrowiae]
NLKSRPLSPETDKETIEPYLLSPTPSIPILRTETPQPILEQNFRDRNFISQVIGFNDNQIPKVDSIFEEGSDSWRAYNSVRKLTQRQKEIEEKYSTEKRNMKLGQPKNKVAFAGSQTNLESAQVFRLLMSQMGLLSLENRHKVIPLQISGRLIKDLEKLDTLNERDCLSTSVYFVKSGIEDYESIINPPSISEDFEKFLNSLGWPVSYKAKLNSSFCETTPYFADRTTEVIFNIPYVIHLPKPEAPSESLSALFKNISADDLVSVVWIEDILSMHNIPPKIGQSIFVYIFVHPLQNATG